MKTTFITVVGLLSCTLLISQGIAEISTFYLGNRPEQALFSANEITLASVSFDTQNMDLKDFQGFNSSLHSLRMNNNSNAFLSEGDLGSELSLLSPSVKNHHS